MEEGIPIIHMLFSFMRDKFYLDGRIGSSLPIFPPFCQAYGPLLFPLPGWLFEGVSGEEPPPVFFFFFLFSDFFFLTVFCVSVLLVSLSGKFGRSFLEGFFVWVPPGVPLLPLL